MGEPGKNQRHPRTMITALRWLALSATTGQANSQFVICRVPCLTLRENTERPVTVTQGTNAIVGCDPKRIVTEALAILDSKSRAGCVPELWDGRAAERILNVLEGMV